MRRLDRQHLEFPFAGSRMLRGLLVAEGWKIGRRHVKTLMKRMGIEALYRRPRTTKPEPGHKSTRIRCAGSRSRDRTRCGRWTSPTSRWRAALSTLAVVLDWFSRRVLVVARVDHDGGGVLRRGVAGRAGAPRQAGIFNTDQGSQFTGAAFTGVLVKTACISMDGRCLARQRLRRAAVAQRQIRGSVSAGLRQRQRARASIGRYLDFYNGRRPHSSLDGRHPIKPTSPRCHSAWQPNPGRRSTYRCGNFVQTTGTTAPCTRRNHRKTSVTSFLPMGLVVSQLLA